MRLRASITSLALVLAVPAMAAEGNVCVENMSIAEMLACRLFLPEHLMPAGLGTEEEIWAEYQTRRGG
jgi:hypothetical protein